MDSMTDIHALTVALDVTGKSIYEIDLQRNGFAWLHLATDLQEIIPSFKVDTEKTFLGLLEISDANQRAQTRAEALENHTGFTAEFRIIAKDGTRYWFRETAMILFEGNIPAKIYGTLSDITEDKNKSAYGRLAYFDDLTGAYNQFRLRDMLEHTLSYCQRYKEKGAYVVIAIDELAKFNEVFGIATGDAVMAELCKRLQDSLRASDVIGRIDGNRLGLVLNKCSEEDVHKAADRFLKSANQTPIITPHGTLQVTISMGSVVFPTHATTAVDCIQKAETALDCAKKTGRNCHVSYVFEEREVADKHALAESGALIAIALAERQFRIAFQPIVHADTQKPIAYECLVRLQHPEKGLLPAGLFIPAAEELGLIRLIDRHVLENITQELESDKNLQLAFNISAMTTNDNVWLDTLTALLKAHPDKAERLIVEITETKNLDETDATVRFVKKIRDLGCHVALDDFGAGYTSFRQLRALPIDYMKIDGDFVRKFNEDEESRLFVNTLLDLAHAFKLKVIAEGIETVEQYTAMKNVGVELLQGYYFAKPTIERTWLQK
jgi:diguanylate cyclase (GGDEF)-like protein